jgi:hypothetical protein
LMRRLPFTPKDLMPFVELVLEDSRDTEKLARLIRNPSEAFPQVKAHA